MTDRVRPTRRLLARADLERSRADAIVEERRAREMLRRAQSLASALDAAQRRGAVSDDLRRRVGSAEAAATRARHDAASARRRVLETSAKYQPHASVDVLASNLNDGVPLLMLPVRLETRFHGSPATSELWIRIYPDDCSIDSFETELSQTEVDSAQRYWVARWAAGRKTPQERAAWRDLCASHGSGRASWIVHEVVPGNDAQRPAKADDEDIVLVFVASPVPTQARRDALAAYWSARYPAPSDTVVETAARQALTQALPGEDPDALIAQFKPANIDTNPPAPYTRGDVTVTASWLDFALGGIPVKPSGWSEAAHARLLPDRFVAIGFQDGQSAPVFVAQGNVIPGDLVVSPDPSAPPAEQLQHDASGELVLPDEMLWLTDFDRALEVGMGIKVPLDPATMDLTKPIRRLVVVGVRLDTPETAARALEELLVHHRYTSAGMSLLPQGTPTNNTDATDSGYSRYDDPDASFDALAAGPVTHTADWWLRTDGEWLADMLGIRLESLSGVPHASGRDQIESRAMHRALWPATFGYALTSMLAPVFTQEQADSIRWFAEHFVSGRGLLPCIRLGRQPYGILPIAAPGTLVGKDVPVLPGLGAPDGTADVLEQIERVLALVRSDFEPLADGVAAARSQKDAGQFVLDLLGLHPTSVEFHQRYSEGLTHLFNAAKFQGISATLADRARQLKSHQDAIALLTRLGYGGDPPELLSKLFFAQASRLNGVLIDDRPLSETDPIRVWTTDNRNYLAWLASASLDDLRVERGFTGDHPPSTLLYILLRHALLLGFYGSAVQARDDAGVITNAEAAAARREQPFVHVDPDAAGSESRWTGLYEHDVRITHDPNISVGEYLGTHELASTAALADQRAALELLADVPTARLERCLTEHVDLASYRLDAWLLGLVHYRMATLRYQSREGGRLEGVHLGAYACVEDLAPSSTQLTLAVPRGRLAIENQPQAGPVHDPQSGGYIFAPSMAQATSAAVLRAGYLASASTDTPDALAVNLSSKRVRRALEVIDGIRNGQSLGALLGYRLEQTLHRRDDGLELDRFIYALRQQFPLVANQMASTKEDDAPVETLEASNVPDGLALAEYVRTTGAESYPFGLEGLPSASTAEAAAIGAAVGSLREVHDALGDLALAEGVHQAVLGNVDQAAATLDAYSKGTLPPEPSVIKTPRSGLTVSHRVAVHLEAGVASDVSPVANVPVTPRLRAQPMVNAWLAQVLPAPDEVGARVIWTDPADGSAHDIVVTQEDLGLQPIDLLHVGVIDDATAMRELDDRIMRFVVLNEAPRSDAAVSIQYSSRLAGKISFFELAPLLRHLRSLLLRSRPLRPTDLMPGGSARRAHDTSVQISATRVDPVRAALEQLRADIAAFAAPGDVDALIDQLVELFERAARFGMQQVGWGFMYEWRRQAFGDVLARGRGVLARWDDRVGAFDLGLGAYDAAAGGMSERERMTELGKLDLLLATSQVEPPPADAVAYRAALPARRATLANERATLTGIVSTADPRVSALIAAVKAELPKPALDAHPFSLDDVDATVARFVSDAQTRLAALETELTRRRDVADAGIARAAASATPADQADARQDAAAALLGSDMRLVPEFKLTGDSATMFATSLTAGRDGSLTSYLTSTRGRVDPVADWLHGAARVREKAHAWEQAVIFAQLLGNEPRALEPAQLPFAPGEGWLALEFDPAHTPDSERLLYTASYAAGFDPTADTCGLLLDEWTEVIPADAETPAVSFQFRSPRAKPAQSWLLVAPTPERAWSLDQIVSAIGEALALARLRAIEPAQIETTPYASFLPATLNATTRTGITIATNLARMNNLGTELGNA